MEETERIQEAAVQIKMAIEDFNKFDATPDPVARRRLMVRAAKALRGAANALDDSGYLTE